VLLEDAIAFSTGPTGLIEISYDAVDGSGEGKGEGAEGFVTLNPDLVLLPLPPETSFPPLPSRPFGPRFLLGQSSENRSGVKDETGGAGSAGVVVVSSVAVGRSGRSGEFPAETGQLLPQSDVLMS
jgi:hypothetical protein